MEFFDELKTAKNIQWKKGFFFNFFEKCFHQKFILGQTNFSVFLTKEDIKSERFSFEKVLYK